MTFREPAGFAPAATERQDWTEFMTGLKPAARNRLNLARPWKFPAAHEDSLLCRRHSRSTVQVPIEIALIRPDGSPYDRGTAVIRDLSYSGLRLGDVFLARGRLLVTHFRIELRPVLESPPGGTIPGRILRTYTSGFPGFGIEFLSPGSGAEKRLRPRN